MCAILRVAVLLFVCVMPSSVVSAAVISLDFNVLNTQSPFQESPTKSGEEGFVDGPFFTGQVGEWNTLLVGSASFTDTSGNNPESITSPLMTGNLLAGDGSATLSKFTYGVGATVGTPVNYDVFSNPGTGSTNLRQDMFLLSSSRPTVTWEIEGLLPGNSYDVLLFGQRYNNASFNSAAFTIFGNGPDSFDSQRDGNFANIIANAQGKIIGTYAYGGTPSFGAWSGLQIEGTFAVPPVPEPSGLLLTGMGMLGLLRHVRRRHRA